MQGLDQLVERHVLMGLCANGSLPDLRQQLPQTEPLVHHGAQHLGIDEKSHQPFQLGPVAVGHRNAHADVRKPRMACQQQLKGCQKHHEGRQSLPRTKLAYAFGQWAIDHPLLAGHRVMPVGPAWCIGRQFQHRAFALQACRPVCQLPVALPGFHPAPLPGCIVGVPDGQRRKVRLPALHGRVVDLPEFLHQQLQGPVIGNDVVHHHDQHMLLCGQPDQPHPQQVPCFQIERGLLPLLHELLHAFSLCFGFQVMHICLFHGRDAGFIHILAYASIRLHPEPDLQLQMPVCQLPEAAYQRRHVQRTTPAQRTAQVIGAAFPVELPQKPLPLLGVGQRCAALCRHRSRHDGKLRPRLVLVLQLLVELSALGGRELRKPLGQSGQHRVTHRRLPAVHP